jgi:hypothetical protein
VTRKQAIKLAIEAIEKEMQKLAFDAAMFDLKLASYGFSQKASKKRKRLKRAIELFSAEIS